MPIDPNLEFPFDEATDLSAYVGHLALPGRNGHFDELRADGTLRAHWQSFFQLLGKPGLADLEHRRTAAASQIRDNGVTYNVYADAGLSRPWSLDILPFILDAADWAHIEAAVAQRARLLNAILADVYGPQQLLNEGMLPPALVYGHPGYLRTLDGFTPPGGVYLHIAAFDLARMPDGHWCVVSQRTQAPSGLGYALENRLIISRLFPQAFREMQVQHLASSYRRLLDTLYHLCPPGSGAGGTPRIVLLTPGPYNETYFEHAYLARYLGLPLVEGGDLTVRDDQLFLKTLSGLEPVQGVLRRLDDDFCDPLELRPDSTLGVPGLLQAVRAGNVLVANALGSSFLESPGLHAFLPAMAQRLLGEELAMPSLLSWWCGEEAALEHVLPDLDQFVLKSTYPRQGTQSYFEPQLGQLQSSATLQEWQDHIRANPDAYTAQDQLQLSQSPVWSNGKLVPRSAMVRVFAIANAEGGWHVLPGGLSRIGSKEQQIISLQHGGSSLDTWVLAPGEVDTFSMLPERLRPQDLADRRRLITSRAAENLFWMGRYTERAEQGVRLARLVLSLLETNDLGLEKRFLDTVSRLSEQSGLVPTGTPSLSQAPRIFERALHKTLTDANGNYGIAYNLGALARAAAPIRDRLSPEHARLVLTPGEHFTGTLAQMSTDGNYATLEATAALDQLAIELAAITGEQMDRMTRDDGWRLLTLGRHLERLASMSAALAVSFDSLGAPHGAGFEFLLGIFDSTITYRRYYQRRHEIPALLDLLICDDSNPRSISFVLNVLRQELARLPDPSASPIPLGDLLPQSCPPLAELCKRDAQGHYAALGAFIGQMRHAAMGLSDEISLRHFSHTRDVNTALFL